MNRSNVEIAKDYLAALERGVTGDALAAFFTADVVQEEFPNRLVPSGATRDLAALLDGAVRGQKILQSQRFQVLNTLPSADTVVLEVQWTASFSVPLGTLAAGQPMRARFAVFLEFRDGRICRQRNYDCFDPW